MTYEKQGSFTDVAGAQGADEKIRLEREVEINLVSLKYVHVKEGICLEQSPELSKD